MQSIGGVLLAAGMEMDLVPGDYAYGQNHIRFMIERVVLIEPEWVTIEGTIRPTPVLPWTPETVRVRVDALKRSLALY